MVSFGIGLPKIAEGQLPGPTGSHMPNGAVWACKGGRREKNTFVFYMVILDDLPIKNWDVR